METPEEFLTRIGVPNDWTGKCKKGKIKDILFAEVLADYAEDLIDRINLVIKVTDCCKEDLVIKDIRNILTKK